MKWLGLQVVQVWPSPENDRLLRQDHLLHAAAVLASLTERDEQGCNDMLSAMTVAAAKILAE